MAEGGTRESNEHEHTNPDTPKKGRTARVTPGRNVKSDHSNQADRMACSEWYKSKANGDSTAAFMPCQKLA